MFNRQHPHAEWGFSSEESKPPLLQESVLPLTRNGASVMNSYISDDRHAKTMTPNSSYNCQQSFRQHDQMRHVVLKIWSKLQLYLLLGIVMTVLLRKLHNQTRYFWSDVDRQSFSFQSSITASTISTSTPVLDVFQVHSPVLTPSGYTSDDYSFLPHSKIASDSCDVLLMTHSFGYSYNKPFIGNYTPPKCNFNRVVMNFTVTSEGRQFDRLAIMYFGDSEVWRTSTAEPKATGIQWTYTKDMSQYIYFWRHPQTLIFDLGNLVDNTYTGLFNTTLTASFFTISDTPEAASLIIPISSHRGKFNQPSLFILPSTTAINNVVLPRNVDRAIFTISSCGQGNEEFWWANVLQSNIATFPELGSLPGFSPWREVQLYIDGNLAGVQWPFPIIFTGGVVPSLWRPVVGVDAFDLREREIDITPWLPLLCDGNEHTFEIKVAGILDDGNVTGWVTESVDYMWYVTGKIFIWESSNNNSITTGAIPITTAISAPLISVSQSLSQNSSGTNSTLAYNLTVSRHLTISSTITTSNTSTLISWTQDLSFTFDGIYSDQGHIQHVTLTSSGTDKSLSNSKPTYTNTYSYPASANMTYYSDPSGNFTLTASLTRGLSMIVAGDSALPESWPVPQSGLAAVGSYIRTSQEGSAYYFASPSTKTGMAFGNTDQEFVSGNVLPVSGAALMEKELYSRSLRAANDTLYKDREIWLGGMVRYLNGSVSGGDSGTEATSNVVGLDFVALGRMGTIRGVVGAE